MTPLEKYNIDLKQPDFFSDPAQKNAIQKLQDLYDKLVLAQSKRQSRGLLASFRKSFSNNPQAPIKGLYMWGGVGRGKTYLMDSFFDTLPFENKQRFHFHRFMQRVHNELTALQGVRNPLDRVAEDIAQSTCIVCFDEFFVTDITDAMILGGLFERLFAKGVVLVATSNIVPDGLYKNGLQRKRFLPAIAAIKENCDVLNVDSGEDYRLRTLKQAVLYHWPLGDVAQVSLERSWKALVSDSGQENVDVVVNGRQIPAVRLAQDAAWFTFDALCNGPRSQNDYIEIARIFNTVLLSDVPLLQVSMEDQARRFINLVDEFYDRQVKLIISAEVAIDAVYQGRRLAFEIQRTQSRLLEMQSEEYLSKPHRP